MLHKGLGMTMKLRRTTYEEKLPPEGGPTHSQDLLGLICAVEQRLMGIQRKQFCAEYFTSSLPEIGNKPHTQTASRDMI